MIPVRIDADAEQHFFQTDERQGYHIVFASREAMKESPFHPHWVGTCGDEESLQAMTRWMAVRRDQWQEWGALAERIGHSAFAQHMDDLLKAEPLVRVEAALVQRQDDPSQVGIGEMTCGPDGVGFDILHVHTFSSVEACNAFHAWLNAGDNHSLAGGLVTIAYTGGTDELAAALDEIAAEQMATPRRQSRGRRRGGGGGRVPASARLRQAAETATI